MNENREPISRREARKQLLNAVRNNALVELESLVELYPNLVDQRNAHGNTPLRTAIAYGHLTMAKRLVELGAELSQINHGGSTLLEVAAYQGSTDIMAWLESQGLDVGIFESSAVGDIGRVRKLVRSDVSCIRNRDRRNRTPLHYAAHTGRVEIIDLLVEAGAKVDALDKHSHSPLAVGVEANQFHACERLLKFGANADARGGQYRGSVLHRAVLGKNVRLVELLLNAGANPNATDVGGKTPLHDAIGVGRKDLVAVLLNAPRIDASIRCKSTKFDESGETPLEYALHRKKITISHVLEDHLSSTNGVE